MAVALGLSVALAYGAADFFGGLSARRATTAAVVVVSQGCSLVLLAALLAVGPDADATWRDLALGTAAGGIGCVGLSLLYFGLARGRMSVVAPVTAVGAAVIPVAWGLGRGERPSGVALAGVVAAVGAVGLIARPPTPAADELDGVASVSHLTPGRELVVAVGAGLAFGAVFILFGETGAGAGVWPLVSARVVSVAAVGLAALVAGTSLSVDRTGFPAVAAAGVLDMTANALYLVAVRHGLLSLVAPVASLYPAGTVLLARVVLHEDVGHAQLAGLGVAACGIAAIAVG